MDWVMSQGKFSMVTELMSGFRVVGDAYGENVYGLVLLPSYRFSPIWRASSGISFPMEGMRSKCSPVTFPP